MCGIAGFVVPEAFALNDPLRTLSAMTSALRHRGPDDEGVWFDSPMGVGLGHRRLSVLDLSKAGHQPMQSPSGRFIIVFNGEIYNHLEMRAALEARMNGLGRNWRGHSDTETLLCAIEAWGIERAFTQAIGMFAAAVLDCEARTLTLIRDRMGEKPLYYGWRRGAFVFASELKALRAFDGFSPTIDPDALGLYVAFGYVPAPWSIYDGVRKLTPGSVLTFDVTGSAQDRVRQTPFWSLAEAMRGEAFRGTDEEAADELERRLAAAVTLQKVADVPLGCFLSGGIDSSTVTALLQAQSNKPVRTFTVGFDEETFNEAPHAAAVARHLGTDHAEMTVTAADALELIPRLPEVWDEPFSDSSQLPTLLIAAFARKTVTVCLSGDGGDELFGGYPRYALSQAIERLPAKKAVAALLRIAPLNALATLARFVPASQISAPRLRSLERLLASEGRLDRYRMMLAQVAVPRELVRGASAPPTKLGDIAASGSADELNLISSFDAVTYLPDDILVKLDRAAMAVSLETRLPLLDHRVVEFAFRLPSTLKRRHGKTKWLLRRILERYVPTALTDRPKQGFSVPIAAWLRGPLRQWAADLLTADALRDSGLEPRFVARLWQQHQSGMPHLQNMLWGILMYQAWRLARHP